MSGFPKSSKSQILEWAQLREKKHRKASGLFLIEGPHLFEEFAKSRLAAEWIAVEESFLHKHPGLAKRLAEEYAGQTWLTPAKDIERLSDTEQPQGLVAAVFRPRVPAQNPGENESVVLILDRIADPGNLGTMLRSADWFGVRTVFLSRDCAEAFGPKSVRATMGSIFRLTVVDNVELNGCLGELKSKGFTTVAADMGGGVLPEKIRRTAILIGSEAHGIRSEVLPQIDHVVQIPKRGHGESLNASVACGILLHEITKPS